MVFFHDYVLYGIFWVLSKGHRQHQRNVYWQTVRLYGLEEANRRHWVLRHFLGKSKGVSWT